MAEKPPVAFTRTDGNAFAILAACREAALRAGWSEERWLRVQSEMMSGDYAHLLGTAAAHFEVS